MDKKQKLGYQQIGVFVTIPFTLGVPPLIGWMIGRWMDGYFATQFLAYTLLVLGMIAGARECYRIIRKFGSNIEDS